MSSAVLSFAQRAHFVTEGEITFEKTVNIHAILKKNIAGTSTDRLAAFEQFKKSQDQFFKQKSKLVFNKTASSFYPESSVPPAGVAYFGVNPWYMQLNRVYAALASDSVLVQKDILSQVFSVKDKRMPIKWKITDETREIAGYSCRRANGLVYDSVYVVAFFTNKIPVAGGPESFHGLPGMILGLAIPYEHVTWFATGIVEKPVPNVPIIPEQKGKQLNRKELEGVLRKSLSTLHNWSEALLIGYLL